MTGKDLLERRRKNSIEAPQEEPAQESVGLTGKDLLNRRRKDRETEKLGPRYWVDETHYYTENPFPTAAELYPEKYNRTATGSPDLSPSLTDAAQFLASNPNNRFAKMDKLQNAFNAVTNSNVVKTEKQKNRERAHQYMDYLKEQNPDAYDYITNNELKNNSFQNGFKDYADFVDKAADVYTEKFDSGIAGWYAGVNRKIANAIKGKADDVKTDTYKKLVELGMSDEEARYWDENANVFKGIIDAEDAEKRRNEYISNYDQDTIDAINEYVKVQYDAELNYGSDFITKMQTADKVENARKELKNKGIDVRDKGEYQQLYEYLYQNYSDESAEEMRTEIQNNMEENPASIWGYNALDVITSPVQGVVSTVGTKINDANKMDKSQPSNVNGSWGALQNLSTYTQEGTNEQISKLANGNKWGEKTGQFAYGVGSSTAKSLWSMYLGGAVAGGITEAMGLTGTAANVVGRIVPQLVTLPSFGGSAYATTLKNQLDKGMGQDQAQAYAVMAGINEMLYEELSLDKAQAAYLKGLGSASAAGKKALIKNALSQAGIEGSEEVLTELSNKLADGFINHDFSDHNTRVRNYVEQGYSEEEAEALVRKEEIAEITETFFAGAASGGITGAVQTGRGIHDANRVADNIMQNPDRVQTLHDDIINNAPEDSKARQIMESTKAEDLTRGQVADALISLQQIEGSVGEEEWLANELVKLGETEEEAKTDAQTILNTEEQVRNSLDVEEELNTKLSNGEQLTQDDVQKLSDLRTQAEETNKKYDENKNLAEVHNKYNEGKMISPAEIAAREIATANREMQQEKEEKRRNSLDNRLGLGSYSYKANANGQRLGIESFAEVTPNGAKLNTSRGVIDINDMQFDNPTQEALFKGAMQLENAEAANNMLKDYKGQDVRSYVYASQLAYFMGENGQKLDKLFNDNSAEVSVALDHMQEADKNNAHLQAMWELGTQNQQKRTVETVNVEQAKEQKKLDVAENDELAAVKQAFSNAFGFNISTDYSETGYNAKWVSSLATVFTTTNSKSSNEYDAIVHEMGEFTRAMNPEAYDNLKRAIMDFVVENKGEKALDDYIKAKQEVYRDAGRREERFKNEANKTYSQAADEFVNDFLAGAFATENGMKQMVDHVATSENFSASEKVSIFQSISDWINHLIDTIKNFLAGKKHNSSARLAMELEEMGKDLTELRSIALEALDGAKVELRNQLMQDVQSESNEAAEEFMGDQLYSEEDIEEASQENFSLDHDDDFMKNAIKENAKKGNANIDVFVLDRAKAVRKITKNELERMKQYLPEDIMGNIVVKNSSYSRSVENSLICVRSLVSGYFSDMVSERVGHPLSIEQQIITNQILAGLTDDQTECTYCYVKNDRMTYRAMFNSYYDQYMNQMDKVKANREAYENDIDYGYEEFLDGRKATKQMHDRYVHFVKDALAGEQSLSLKDLTTGKKRATFANKNSMQAWLVRDAERYSKSAAWPKSTSRKVKVNGTSRSLEYIAYNGNILKWDKSVIDALNSEFGLRMYSDSDYVPAFLLENMQVITDASIRGLKMLSYTKDCGYARVFGGTGMGINISCFGFWDENTQSVLMDGMMGADWEEAKAVRSQYNNVGTVFVATNDKCLEWALDQDWIDVVIPFHLVRTGNDIAAAYGYKNYKAQQEDKKNANWDKEKNLKSIPPTVHANNKEAYLAALEANNLKPRFEQYIDHPNYMKLVNETRMSYKDMMPVQPVFDLEEVRKELARIPKEGAYGMLKGISDLETQDRLLESYAEEAVNKIEGKEAFSLDISDELIETEKVKPVILDIASIPDVSNMVVNYQDYKNAWIPQVDELIKQPKETEPHLILNLDKYGIRVELAKQIIQHPLIKSFNKKFLDLPEAAKNDALIGWLIPQVLKSSVITNKLAPTENHRYDGLVMLGIVEIPEGDYKGTYLVRSELEKQDERYALANYGVEYRGYAEKTKKVATSSKDANMHAENIEAPSYGYTISELMNYVKQSFSKNDKVAEQIINDWDDYLNRKNQEYIEAVRTGDKETQKNDIRYSLDEDNFDAAVREMMELGESVTKSENRLAETLQQAMDFDSDMSVSMSNKVAKRLIDQYTSNLKRKDLGKAIHKVFSYINKTGKITQDAIEYVRQGIASDIVDSIQDVDESQKAVYNDFVNKVKTYDIALDGTQMAEIRNRFDTYMNFKRYMSGKLNLNKNGIQLDEVWTEICDMSNGALNYGENPANQPIALAEYINSLAPKARILENTTYEDATLDVAMEVFRQYFEEVADKEAALKIRDEVNKHNKAVRDMYKERFSDALKKAEMAKDIELDRLAKEIDNLTAEEQEALNQFGASIETEVIQKMKAQYIDRYAKLKQQKNEEIAKIKLDYRNDKIEKRSRRAKTEALDKLKREINALESMLAHPKEGATKHVPKQLVNATIDLLNAINQDTGKNKAVKEKLAKLAAIYDQLRIQNNATTNDKTNYGFDYDERIAEDIKEIQQIFEGGKTYDDLYVPEVERILEIVTALKTQIKNANNLIIDGQIQDARAVAEGAMSEVVGSRHYVNKTVDRISNAFNAYSGLHLNPYREFRRLSGYVDGQMMKLYKDLEEGSLKEMQIQKDLGEIFNDVLEGKENQKEVRRFISNKPGDLVEIGIVDEYGKPVKVSRAMRMSIIMHSKNEGNMTHIIFGGMNVPDMAEYKRDKVNAYEKHGKIYRFLDYTKYIDAVKRQDRAAAMQMTEDARNTIKGLEDDLSEWERNFLDDAMELFHNKTGEYINETSETLKGYTVARVKNYFPIKTDTKFVATDFAGLVQNGTIEGMGMLKERIRSNKPIMLEDITDVIQRQITNTARYSALAIPVRNVKMAMKQIFRSSIDNRGELTTLEDVIGKVWSKGDVDNIKNLITALETGRGTNDDRMKWVSKLRGNFSGAVLTLNPSVAIKQAASFPTAAAVVGYKALGRAMLDIGKGFITQKGIAELEKINPLLWYRNQGYATQDLADAKASGYMKNLPLGLQKALGWTQFMDSGTVRTLEYASMYYVEDNFKNLHRGSQAYWKKVSEIFTKVVTETQPNYDTMHKANIIRDGNALEKLLIMFKTQPFQNFGILYDAIGELNANSIRYKDNKSAENKTALKNSVRNLAKAVTSQMVSAVTFSAMTILADLLLHRWKKYRDDDDELSIVAILSQLGSGAFSAFTGMFIAASDIINAVESFVNNKSFDGIDISTFSMLTDFLNSMTNLKKNIEKYNDAETTSDKMKAGQNIAKYSLKVTEYAGQIFGLPVGNIERMLQSVGLYVDDAITSAETGEPHVSSRSSFTDKEISSQYEMMLEAFLEGNTAEYDKLYNELIESGKSDKDIESKIKSMIKAEYGEGKIEPEKAVEGLEGLGFEESEAKHTLAQWETGQNNKYGAMKTYINNAVDNPNGDNRRAVVNEIENLVGMGITKENILKNLKTEYKERYSEEINKGAGTELNSILRQALVAAGYTDDEAKEKLKAWVD